MRAVAGKVHKIASGVMALTGISVVAVGGYALFAQLSANALTPATATGEAVREPTAILATAPAEEGVASRSKHSSAPTSSPRRLCRQPRPRRVASHRSATPRSTPRNSLLHTLIAASFFITCANSRTPLLNLLSQSVLMERAAALSGRRRHRPANAIGNNDGAGDRGARTQLPYRPLSPIWSRTVMTDEAAAAPSCLNGGFGPAHHSRSMVAIRGQRTSRGTPRRSRMTQAV